MASLIKVSLMLPNKESIPNIRFNNPNPKIDFIDGMIRSRPSSRKSPPIWPLPTANLLPPSQPTVLAVPTHMLSSNHSKLSSKFKLQPLSFVSRRPPPLPSVCSLSILSQRALSVAGKQPSPPTLRTLQSRELCAPSLANLLVRLVIARKRLGKQVQRGFLLIRYVLLPMLLNSI